MATYYAHFGLTTGNNDGSSPENAWRSMQDVLNAWSSKPIQGGDVVLCKGTDYPTATLAMTSTHSGTAGNHVILRGVNDSWMVDGTCAVLNANGGAFDLVTMNGTAWVWFEYFQFSGAGVGKSNLVISNEAPTECVFYRCKFTNGGSAGAGGTSGIRGTFIQCLFANNSGVGFHSGTSVGAVLIGCVAMNNGSYGISINQGIVYGCLSINNTNTGIHLYGGNAFNCVSHGNGSDGLNFAFGTLPNTINVIGCRVTGNTGVAFYKTASTYGHIYLAYAGGNSDTFGGTGYATVFDSALFVGSGSDTNHGYVDPGNLDFSLASTATFFDVPITLPMS